MGADFPHDPFFIKLLLEPTESLVDGFASSYLNFSHG